MNIASLRPRLLLIGLFTLAGSALLSTIAAAQTVSEMLTTICDTALATFVSFGFVLLFLILLILAGYQLVLAFKDLGSHKQQTAEQGRNKARNGAITFVGALAVAPIVALLGLWLPECFAIDLGPITGGGGGAFILPGSWLTAVAQLGASSVVGAIAVIAGPDLDTDGDG